MCPRPRRAITPITVRCFPTTPRSVFVSSRPYPRDNRPHTDSSSPCPDCTRSRKGRRASRPPSRSRAVAWTARSIRPARTILSSSPENTRSDSATRHRVLKHFNLIVRLAANQTEIVLANGVGQGPALSLRLISFSGAVILPPPSGPMLTDPSPSQLPSPSQSPSPHDDSGASGSASHAGSNPVRWDGRILPGFQAVGVSFLALTTDMVGRPTDSTPYTESPTGWPSPGAGPSGDRCGEPGAAGCRDPIPVDRPAIRMGRLSRRGARS